ncbi:hypothetical protein NEOLEDRAFT_485816 [Neolentinus lepideus HHB14362 ss-1]|uniref:C2H2-type domain-containing protein n=1 Tax=Neolentinus lepideus HHB14362 ss-1 TaxID=1314782 RepID=A0A165VMZ6_9AGAM|nr:hypothetical protein NEOLEDRAFT_485816 [Neolentinus lepideus HHB14362 ss-1]
MPSLTCGGPACSGRPFSNKYQLNYHVLNSPLHFHCKPCKKAFKDEVAYKQHRKSSREHSPYCDLCDARFVTYEDLEHHFKSAQRHQNCKQCKVGFYDTAMLTAHRVYAHPKIACAQCPELGQKFQDEDLHKHYFSSAKHPSCITCRIGFADGAAYAEHQMDVHLSDAATPPIVQIEQTRIVSPTPSGSLNEASNRGEENVLCPGPACKSRKFSSEAALVQHLNTSQAHIQCCGRGFKLEMHYFQVGIRSGTQVC